MSRPSSIPLSRPCVTKAPVPLSHTGGHEIPLTRARRPILRSLDAFFRRRDTWLAEQLNRLSSTRGTTYAGSLAKRALDLVVSVPLAVIIVILIVVLATVNKLFYPRQPALFRQDRVGNAGGALRVVKIRSMERCSSPGGAHAASTGYTRIGRFMRRHYLDELPQFFHVWAGQLCLVGIRVLPVDVYVGLADAWSAERFETWQQMYATAPLGLTGVQQVFRTRGKEDERRFHRDMFYARHASLGFDLYLLWRTLGSCDKEIHDAIKRR
jgi:lipopolysaccharide/colanic/teichoic acid biosynthesis glycosyltransferase